MNVSQEPLKGYLKQSKETLLNIFPDVLKGGFRPNQVLQWSRQVHAAVVECWPVFKSMSLFCPEAVLRFSKSWLCFNTVSQCGCVVFRTSCHLHCCGVKRLPTLIWIQTGICCNTWILSERGLTFLSSIKCLQKLVFGLHISSQLSDQYFEELLPWVSFTITQVIAKSCELRKDPHAGY